MTGRLLPAAAGTYSNSLLDSHETLHEATRAVINHTNAEILFARTTVDENLS
ncbi:hypothetical protein SAMN02745947_05637 [Rhodococcus rhodochrous J3]|uniref:Uncharacterized protein n=1 Tax=Rhodococcus rhodochrous J3 TaxID=903528 RepID=A0ABY1MJJ3_RHORH|nr:hypothetical protein [Rhodococcus rhodochrous]MBF4478976.1 hypothetical protein [Rhodococcus rhodochrous]TWH38143.1 hypothetical protein L612_006900000040 [Rhodococcus rhodochrous J38]SMG60575.1 hypothetical protein SAMN02745947_05637 [Rhodococcus rhodochrous J3]